VIAYPIPGTPQRLLFGAQALSEFARWRQLRHWAREAGGQLFAREGEIDIHVAVVGPRATDRRSRVSYTPDREAERIEIVRMHAEGMHFVGDWHTHPEDRPDPSMRDRRSMSELFTRSSHGLNAMLLIIVGRLDPPEGLYVGLHDGAKLLRLRCEDAAGDGG